MTEDEYKSKTQRKRECGHQQQLAERLLALKPSDLAQIDIPEQLDAALEATRKIHSRAALRRQRQYLGKLMRSVDHDRIAAQLEAVLHQHDTNTAQFRRIEKWRDRLLEGEDGVLEEIIGHHPDVDRQHVHALVRQAQKERREDRPPATARKLFRYLRDLEGL